MNTKNKQSISSLDELTQFERAIVKAHPENLISAIAEGPRSIGKSMFLLKTGTHVFQFVEGLPLDDAYVRALDHFLFTTPDVIKAIDKVMINTDFSNIRQYDLKNKYRFLAIDDIGAHLGKYKFYVDVGLVDDMKGRIDTIRDVTSCLLMSAPALSGLLSFLREYPDNKIIDITFDEIGDPKYGRIISVRLPRKRWQRKGNLAYPPIRGSIFVDDWAYDEYKVRKRKALIELFSKKKSKNKITAMFNLIRKLNPNLSIEDVIERLDLPSDVISDMPIKIEISKEIEKEVDSLENKEDGDGSC